MTNKEKIIQAVKGCADDDNTILFGFVADISQENAPAKVFAKGKEEKLAEWLAPLFENKNVGIILIKALSMWIRHRIDKLELTKNNSNDETRHSDLN